MGTPVFLIAGLGNPGASYEKTRHNLGFRCVDTFAERQGWHIVQAKMQGLFCKERFMDVQVLLVKPQSYMNRSGYCVRALADYFDVDMSRLIVVHDDLDLAPGRVKVVSGGGAGGHNGIRSIIAALGSDQFARVKIGIGRPADHGVAGMPVDRFVLSPLGKSELELFCQRKDLVTEALEIFLEKGVQHSMQQINGKT